MKRLLETKVTKDRQSVGDWVSAATQDTLAGLNDFKARQEARRIAAQGKLAPVVTIPTIKRKA